MQRNGLAIFLLLIVGVVALGMYGSAVRGNQPEAIAAQPQSAVTPLSTRVPTATKPSPEQKTLTAGEAELMALEIQNTQVAMAITVDSATMGAQITLAHLEMVNSEKTATSLAIRTSQAISATVQKGTAVALDEKMTTMQEASRSERKWMPYKQMWQDVGQPVLTFFACVVFLFYIGVRFWTVVEKFAMHQMNRDAVDDNVIEVEQPTVQHIEIHRNDGKTITRRSLPATDEQLEWLASGIMDDGKGLTDSEWIGSGFTRAEWYRLRQALLDGGFAAWINPFSHAQGTRLTEDGVALMETIYQNDADEEDDDGEDVE